MKIFKYIAFPVILAAAFACSKEQDTLYGPGEEIRFDAGTAAQQTKAAPAFPTTSDFGVTAFHSQGTAAYQYFDNVQVAYNDGWKTATTLYWPRAAADDGTLLEFRGYSPYAAESPWCTFPNSTTLSGEYSFETPGVSTDLMYANPKAMSPATPGIVNLTFNHALGQTTYSLAVERFDDSIEKGTMTVFGKEFEIYCKYTEKDSPTTDIESKSFVFLSGNYPSGYANPDEYTPAQQAFDLKNPIQNIWYVQISNLAVHNLAWAGKLEMTTADGSAWTKPANNVWSSPADRQSLVLLAEDDPFYFSPNTKGFPMPFGTYFVLPQDLQPVLSSQRPHISMDITFRLFRAEDNAANDSATAGDTRSQIFDYRDIAQYIDESDQRVDGGTYKAGVFKKWYSEPAHRVFPNGTSLDFGTAVLREDARPLLTVTKTIDLPLYDSSKPVNPRYLMMNTNTTYSIMIDPAGQEITFSPTTDSWVELSEQDN